MSTITDAEIIAWARRTAEVWSTAQGANEDIVERYRRLADLAEKGAETWLPIATAPMNGAKVLLRIPPVLGTCVGQFCERERMWNFGPGRYTSRATHWQPLPAPPEGT